MDLLPTLLAAIRARPTQGRRLDGVDLLPVLTGRQPSYLRTVFWRFKRADRVLKCAREGDLKYVVEQGREELHDLAADDLESQDLLPGAAVAARRLKAKLAAWERDVMAPRLRPFRTAPG